MATNQGCKGLVPKSNLDHKYLFYYLGSIVGLLNDLGTGATFKELSGGKLKEVPIPLPPLAEQQRMVTILDEAFSGLATATVNAEKNLKNARELFESQLSRAFNRIVEQHGSRRLAEIVTRLTNGYVGPTRNIYLQSGVPYLLARHVRDNRLEFDEKTFVSDEFNEKNKKSKLKTGDVLLIQSGHIGHSAVVGPDHEGHNCHAMIVITPVPNELSGDFLSFYFGSAEMKRKFEEIRSGSTVPHLTCGLVRELMIPLPGVAEQKQIVSALKEMEQKTAQLSALANKKILRLAQLKQSILQKAFSGELTSPPSQAIKEAAE
jgi:type I restriction enzyme S subunit